MVSFTSGTVSGSTITLTGVTANSFLEDEVGNLYFVSSGSMVVTLAPENSAGVGTLTGTFTLTSSVGTISGTFSGFYNLGYRAGVRSASFCRAVSV